MLCGFYTSLMHKFTYFAVFSRNKVSRRLIDMGQIFIS